MNSRGLFQKSGRQELSCQLYATGAHVAISQLHAQTPPRRNRSNASPAPICLADCARCLVQRGTTRSI